MTVKYKETADYACENCGKTLLEVEPRLPEGWIKIMGSIDFRVGGRESDPSSPLRFTPDDGAAYYCGEECAARKCVEIIADDLVVPEAVK